MWTTQENRIIKGNLKQNFSCPHCGKLVDRLREYLNSHRTVENSV